MQLSRAGAERVIDTAGRGGNVDAPDLVQLNDGRLVLVWAETLGQPSDRFDDTDGAIFGQILTASGLPLDETFQINTFEPFDQSNPEVVPLALGGFAVAWQSNNLFGETVTDPDPLLQFFNSEGEKRSLEPIDAAPDSPPAPVTELDNLFVLSNDRVALALGNGVLAVYNATGNLLFFVSSGISVLQEITSGRTDIVQLESGNIVKASPVETPNILTQDDGLDDDEGDIIRLFLTDTAFESPQGIPGVSAAVPFDSLGNYIDPRTGLPILGYTKDKDDVHVDELAGGGIVLSYAQEVGINRSVIMLETSSAVTERWEQIDPIELPFPVTDARGEHDMIALSGGGIALAYTDADARLSDADVRLNLYDADGTLLSSVLVAGDRPGRQAQPKLLELEDGRIAVAFVDESRTVVGGENSPLRIAYFTVDPPTGRFDGTGNDDTLSGVAGRERLLGYEGDDLIRGRAGDDTLLGSVGNDTLDGGAGRDGLRGEDGDDSLIGGAGADGLGGGAGDDTLRGGEGADILGGGGGLDRLFGDAGDDQIKGGSGADTMDGGDGADQLRAGRGDDVLDGGTGSDRLFGEQGDDTITGGGGNDVFVFRARDAGRDVILDYGTGADTILIVGIDSAEFSRSVSGGDTVFEAGDLSIVVEDAVLTLSDLTFS